MRWQCPGGNRILAAVAAILLLLLAVSCDSTAPSAAYSYGPVPPAVTSSALRPTVEAMEVERYAQAIQAERARDAAEATLAVFWAQETVRVREQSAAATATQQARYEMATATAWAATATAASVQATATARTQAIAATATATSWAATATADAVAWSQAATATRSAWEVQATSTAVAAAAIATAQAAQAEQARLEAERARLVYPVRAYGPWALLFTAFALLLWAGYRMARAAEARVRAVPRDARGDAPLFIDEKGNIIDADRSLYPVVNAQYPQLPPEVQDRVTARDQAVDLMSRGLPGQASGQRRRLPPNLPAMAPPPRALIRIVPPEQVRPWLEEVEPKVLGHIEEEP